MNFSYVESEQNAIAKIKVIGVGGAGGNAVNNMIQSQLKWVQFITANTDLQALAASQAQSKIQLGSNLTKGLGAGARAERGRQAAEESINEIRDALKDSQMVFITAGFGGGTGTGASPLIAEVCKEIGALTVAVVTKPFAFEGAKRMKQAEAGIEELRGIANTVITIQNDRLRGIAGPSETMMRMYQKADEVLYHSVKGITDLIMVHGYVNLDFADVETIMTNGGMALMGIGNAAGDKRAAEAAERAISHPLLEDVSIAGARGVLLNITSTDDITMEEVTEASARIHAEAGEDAEIIWGHQIDESMGENISVTVIATGIGCGRELAASQNKKLRHLNVTRGVVRDVTPSDLVNTKFQESPVYNPVKKVAGQSGGGGRTTHHGLVDDTCDYDIPTFLRRAAD